MKKNFINENYKNKKMKFDMIGKKKKKIPLVQFLTGLITLNQLDNQDVDELKRVMLVFCDFLSYIGEESFDKIIFDKSYTNKRRHL